LKVRPGSSYDTNTGQMQEIVDGMSNWWATIHGYNHPALNEAILQQVSHMSHVMFGGLTHEPAVRLCTKLCQMTGLDLCFLSDSGSVAVEVAMKMALQYWHARPSNRKTKFITVRNGYHGDTLAAMSVCDPINGMHAQFGGVLASQLFCPAPTPDFAEEFDEGHMEELSRTLEQHHESIAAMILEPIVQGAGGMRMYHPQYLRRVRELCTEYNVLMIVDEIATGFGRTNRLFAYEHAAATLNPRLPPPDIVCLGKALTGGYMSLAATLTTSHVAEVIHSCNSTTARKSVLMHGPTFMGNPLACSVALASISLLEQSPPWKDTQSTEAPLPLPRHTDSCTDWKRSVPMIEQQLRAELAECGESPLVANVRVLGAIGVVEMKEPIQNMVQMQHAIVKEHGVWLRPFGKLVYTMPPFIIAPEQLRRITSAMVQLTRRRF
jgi:adenosylmethionine---8-amino-7-oxononanoate aminotransferase